MRNRILNAVKEKTGLNSGWQEICGPTTGVGVEYWFKNKNGIEVYVCDDQGSLTISVSD